MRSTKNAFTLVELIVVITILAILGTIAFISLQGYSADARNSKRTSDIGNIQSAISLKQVEGVPLMSFVDGDENKLSAINLAGSGSYAGDYSASVPSYTVLNVAEKDFKDPQGDQEYRIGATNAQNGVFQIAATMEIDGTDTAQVNGTYLPRTASGYTIVSSDGAIVTLNDTNANTFKAGDTITGLGATATKIIKVSRDGVTLTMNGDVDSGTTIGLAVLEEVGLIDGIVAADGTPSTGNPLENLDNDYLPY